MNLLSPNYIGLLFLSVTWFNVITVVSTMMPQDKAFNFRIKATSSNVHRTWILTINTSAQANLFIIERQSKDWINYFLYESMECTFLLPLYKTKGYKSVGSSVKPGTFTCRIVSSAPIFMDSLPSVTLSTSLENVFFYSYRLFIYRLFPLHESAGYKIECAERH